jgi:glycosyltransferase involved in cell wall biosynthesis
MKLPRISIVTPSYNHAAYVEWTVRSVLLQRYSNLEYIVMDGGSKDATCSILAPYRSHFAYFASEKDGGQADAIARGFERCTGEIMGYLNSDDMLAPDTLHFVADYFQAHPEVDVIYSHRCHVDAKNRVVGYWLLPPHDNYLIQRYDLIPQETCFWRRRIFEKAGNIDANYRFAMDYDFFVRLMNNGTVMRVNRALGAFRVHEQSKTWLLLATLGEEEKRRVLDKYGLTITWRDRLRIAHTTRVLRWRSWWHVKTRRLLPGALPGIGYDYDDVWGGQLNERRLPEIPAVVRRTAAAA